CAGRPRPILSRTSPSTVRILGSPSPFLVQAWTCQSTRRHSAPLPLQSSAQFPPSCDVRKIPSGRYRRPLPLSYQVHFEGDIVGVVQRYTKNVRTSIIGK